MTAASVATGEPAPAPACRVERLRLFRFRNYLDETVELGAGLNVVCGENAQGKTNLLEAVATLALTRSPRAGAMGEFIAWGEPVARVEARVRRGERGTDLDMRITRRAAAAGADATARTTLVDGKERPARALLGLCPVVLFWPDDLQLVKGAPEARRRLLDVVLSQLDPVAADDLVRYRRALEQRNSLLRQIRQGTASAAALPQFTDALVRHGGAVRAHRARLVERLSPQAATAMRELSGGDEVLALAYACDGEPLPEGVEEGADGGDVTDAASASERLAATLRARSTEELARGLTVAGPHRDDVAILLDGRPARSSASQGQQRSAVLACKLAEVRHVAATAGVTPVLLLDDVLSELDPGRRGRLLAELGAGGQALLTTAEPAPALFDDGGAVRRFRVEAGRIVAES